MSLQIITRRHCKNCGKEIVKNREWHEIRAHYYADKDLCNLCTAKQKHEIRDMEIK